MSLISVMLDTSHSPIGPCTPSEQPTSRVNSRQAVTALLSSAFDCGENNIWPAQECSEMEMTRAKKMAWWCDGKGVDACWDNILSLLLCLSVSVSVCVTVSAWLTRVHSQLVGVENSPESSGIRPCGDAVAMAMSSLECVTFNANVRWWPVL